MPHLTKKKVPGVPGMPAFCSAVITGNQVFVSGMLGTVGEALELVSGGIEPQTRQALQHLQTILAACGCSLDDVAKVNVYLVDMTSFGTMNDVYSSVFGDSPPARITVGCSALALGALIEMDCVAVVPDA